MYTGFRWGKLRKGGHLEDLGIDGKIMLRWVFRKWDGYMDWIFLAQDRDSWPALVKAVMKLKVP